LTLPREGDEEMEKRKGWIQDEYEKNKFKYFSWLTREKAGSVQKPPAFFHIILGVLSSISIWT
jgi:hypothetical protein